MYQSEYDLGVHGATFWGALVLYLCEIKKGTLCFLVFHSI